MEKARGMDWRVWRGPEDDADPSAIDIASAIDLGLVDVGQWDEDEE